MAKPSDRPGPKPAGCRRYWIYFLLFLMNTIAYGDRAVLSVAMIAIAHEFSLGPAETGWLLSAFLWSYTLFNLPTSILVDRFGARRIAACAVSVWSSAMALSGLATGFASLFAARLLLGLGEAPTFPAGHSAIREWAPRRERGLASTILNCGITGGISLGALIGAYWTDAFGWRILFILLGAIGFVWAAIWLVIFRSPENARWLKEPERAQIMAERSAPVQTPRRVSVRLMLRSPSVWGVIIAQVCANYSNFLFLTWLPTYFVSTGKTPVMAGINTAACYAVAGVGAVLISVAGDRWLANKADPTIRRITVALLLSVGAAGLLSLSAAPSWMIAPLVTIALFGVQAAISNNQALASDLLPDGRVIASFIGLILTFSNGFGILAPIFTGLLVERFGGFTAAFQLAGAALLVGTVAVLVLPRKPIPIP